MSTFTTATDAKAEIATTIENSGVVEDAAAEYDVDAIFDATYGFDATTQVFVQTADVDTFWAEVESHAK